MKFYVPFALIAMTATAGCMQDTTPTSSAPAPKPAVVAAAIAPAPSPVAKATPAPAIAQQLTDGTYTANADGQTATIVVRGGQPVSYRWGTYTASQVSMQGNRITIDQARLDVASIGANSFSGTFVFQGRRTPVVYTKT